MVDVDLTAAAGLPVRLHPASGRLTALPPAELPDEDARSLDAMRPVLRDPEAAGPDPLYWMYRDAGVRADTGPARDLGLRYDLTVLAGTAVGAERVKTFGHVHPAAPGGDLAYPELYQVVAGRGFILLQREREGWTETVAIPCGPADLVLIPPGYAHATVNDGDEPLVLANWVAGGFRSDYGPIAERRGMAFYRLARAGAGGWEPNVRYGRARLLLGVPTPPALIGARAREPIYRLGVVEPGRLRFLVDPAAFRPLWRELDALLAGARPLAEFQPGRTGS